MKLSELDPCLWQSYPEHPASTSGIDFPDIHNDTFAELKPLPPFDYSPNPITNNCSLASAANTNGAGGGAAAGGGGGGGGLASLLSSSALSTTTTLLQPTNGSYDVSTTTSNIKTELAEYLLNSDIDDIAALIGSAIAEQQQQIQINPTSEVSSSTIDPWTELDAWIESACQQPATCLEQDSTIHTTDYNLPSLITNDYGFTTSSPILQARLQSSPQQLPESTTTSSSSSNNNNSNSPNFTNLKVEPGYNTHIEPHVSPTSTTPGLGSANGNGSMTVRYASNGHMNGNTAKVFSASVSGRQHLFSIPIGNGMGNHQSNSNGNHSHSQSSHPQAHHLHQHHLPGHMQHPQHHHLNQQLPHSMHPHNVHNGVGPGGGGAGAARAKKDQRRMDKNSPNSNSSNTKLPSFPSFYTLQQKVKKRSSKKSLPSLSPPSILSTSPSSSSLSPPQNGGVGSTSSSGTASSSSSSNGSHHLGGGGSLSASAATSSSLSDLSDKEKPIHRCNICSRGFLNKSNIKVHLRTHTGEKPFKCEVCSKAFRQKAHLLKHVQIHKRIPRD